MVIGNVSIGHGSLLAPVLMSPKMYPPFSTVIGSSARIIKRYSFEKKAWIDNSLIGDDDQLGYPDEAEYLAKLRALSSALSMPLISASSHFGNL